MKIRKAVHAGYCWGVERALDIVTETAARASRRDGPNARPDHPQSPRRAVARRAGRAVGERPRRDERGNRHHPHARRSAGNLRAGARQGLERRRCDVPARHARPEQGEAAGSGRLSPGHLREPEASRGDRHDRPRRRQGDRHRASGGRREGAPPETRGRRRADDPGDRAARGVARRISRRAAKR